jgi:pSer/pThr/pTyr-binding forkhead associated (FHA) protein
MRVKGKATMFERVILRATDGLLKGKEFVLENGTHSILGRAKDCSPCLFDPFFLISRHHCRIKVAAPMLHIQDLGSRNGTYVNGERIGQRRKEQTFEEALQEEHEEYPLWQGDKLRIGDNVFRVELDPPPPCAESKERNPENLWSCECISCC